MASIFAEALKLINPKGSLAISPARYRSATTKETENISPEIVTLFGPHSFDISPSIAENRSRLLPTPIPIFGFSHEISGIRTKRRKIQNALAQILAQVEPGSSRAILADEH
jgi:hypothetical protein